MVYNYGRSYDDDDAASDVSTENFNAGEKVLLDGKHKAQVAYFGSVHFSHDDDWVGIALDEPLGKHNGTVAQQEYFKCGSMHGLFVRSHRLQRTDALGHASARVKSPYRLRPKSAASMRSHELELEDDMFARADQSDPLGFFEARAGTIRSANDDHAINSKLGQVVDEMHDAEINFASPWIHSSRTPTPTHQRYNATGTGSLLPNKKVNLNNKSAGKPYGIARGYGELDRVNY